MLVLDIVGVYFLNGHTSLQTVYFSNKLNRNVILDVDFFTDFESVGEFAEKFVALHNYAIDLEDSITVTKRA